jgi:hypothetical protein
VVVKPANVLSHRSRLVLTKEFEESIHISNVTVKNLLPRPCTYLGETWLSRYATTKTN